MGLRKLRSVRSFRAKKDQKLARASEPLPPLPQALVPPDQTLTLPALRPGSPLLRTPSTLRLLGPSHRIASDPSAGLTEGPGSPAPRWAHRRSRSFSHIPLPSSLTTSTSSAVSNISGPSRADAGLDFCGQPWRSHDTWMALHQRAAPAGTGSGARPVLPSASTGGGWRSRGAAAGGFFGSETVERRGPAGAEAHSHGAPSRLAGGASRTSPAPDSEAASMSSAPSLNRPDDSPTLLVHVLPSDGPRSLSPAPLSKWTPGPATLFLRQKTRSHLPESEWADERPAANLDSIHSLLASSDDTCASPTDTILRTDSIGHAGAERPLAQVRVRRAGSDSEEVDALGKSQVHLLSAAEKLGLLTRSPTPDASASPARLQPVKAGSNAATASLLPPLLPSVEKARVKLERQFSVTSMRDTGDQTSVPWGKRSPSLISPPPVPSSPSGLSYAGSHAPPPHHTVVDPAPRPGFPTAQSAPALAVITLPPFEAPHSPSRRSTPSDVPLSCHGSDVSASPQRCAPPPVPRIGGSSSRPAKPTRTPPPPPTPAPVVEVLQTGPGPATVRSVRLLERRPSLVPAERLLQQFGRYPSIKSDSRVAPGGWV